MIIRAVVVPHPPLLVPQLVTGAEADTEPLRGSCLAAVRELAEVAPDWMAIAVDAAGPTLLPPTTRGSFRGYGVDVPVSLSAGPVNGPVETDLPLPALVAGWLRAQAGANSVTVRLLDPESFTADGFDLGRRLAAEPGPVGLLVLADGSNRHGAAAPARPDDRAESFDAALRAALAEPDPAALTAFDPVLAAELGVPSLPAFAVLTGAATGRQWTSRLLYSAAPYGVAYHVAVWDPAS